MIGSEEVKRMKARELKPIVKRLIALRAISQKDMPREFLANVLINEIKESGEIPPSVETAKRYISRARNMDDPLEELWSIGCCSKYSRYFQAESISVLVEYIKYFESLPDDGVMELYEYFGSGAVVTFSIGHCIWIIRLKPLVERIFKEIMAKSEILKMGIPVKVAMCYNAAEWASGVIGEKFDSSELDKALFSGNLRKLGSKSLGIWIKGLPTCNGNCKSCHKKSGIERERCEWEFNHLPGDNE
jgi:hypothetical protein